MNVTVADDRGRPADCDVDVIDVEFVAGDASLAGLVRLDVRRLAGATRFLAAVLRPGEEPVVVIDHELPLPRERFELRSSGVWTELCCEVPLDHWTIGLEAFGLSLAGRDAATPASLGDRVALGLDLDLDTVAAPTGDPHDFGIDVRVHGEILIADRAWDFEGTGVRRRRTDGRRPASATRPDHPELLGELAVGWPEDDGDPVVERRGWYGGATPGWVSRPAQASAVFE